MRHFPKIAAGFIVIAALSAPLSALAALPVFLPFGGRIIASLPCAAPEGPATWVTIVPFGIPGTIPFSFIWTFGTFSSTFPPLPSIPPTHPGEQILGTYTPLPYGCITPAGVPVKGLRMLTENNSLPSGGF